jgi:hypothetical protein
VSRRRTGGAFWIPTAQVATPADDKPFKPVARISSLMAGIGTAMGKMHDIFPQTEEEHRHRVIATWSEVIAELSNVHTQHQRKKPDYLVMAADTRSIALELVRAARADAPDEAKLSTLFENLDTSCATCHNADN